MTQRASLKDWRQSFKTIDDCPWPGPRPLTHNDAALMLVGRDQDKVEFRRLIEQNRLVILSGGTGVGKSSLLMCGLEPTLRKAGFTVAVCREWDKTANAPDAATYLSNALRHSLARQGIADLPDDNNSIPIIASRYGDLGVLILDQFEELIRDSPAFKEEVFELIAEINQNSMLKIVVSLRSEYLHELRPLERTVAGYSIARFILDDIDPVFAPDVVSAYDPTWASTPIETDRSETSGQNIASRIGALWQDATEPPTKAASAVPHSNRSQTERAGLLHLQALLYVLWHRGEGQALSHAMLDEFIASSGLTDDIPDASNRLFDQALEDSVEAKLANCRTACHDVGIDSYLIEGATALMRQIAEHLSSGGYKLIRDAGDLLEAAAGDLMSRLRSGLTTAEGVSPSTGWRQHSSLLRAIIASIDVDTAPAAGGDDTDLLTRSRTSIAGAADEILARGLDDGDKPAQSLVELLRPGQSGLTDPLGVTAGPLLDQAPAAALIEELRRFAFAIEWLRASSLVRLRSPGDGDLTVSLIHDRFGSALEQWARRRPADAAGARHALCAAVAEDIDAGSIGSSGEITHLVNLRWKSCSISGDFTNVLFVNCDFTGSYFGRCTFNGAVFVNCLLGGTMLSDCTITGPPPQWSVATDDQTIRRYAITGATEAAQALAHYHEEPLAGRSLVAEMPGRAAAIVDPADLPQPPPPSGSVIILGARLTSTVVRSPSFDDGGTLCLWDSVGSGFDVVDLNRPSRIDLRGCALRSLSFTRTPASFLTPEQHDEADARLDLVAEGSALYQLWIGDGLVGSFTSNDCDLAQVWVRSTAIVAKATRGTYFGLVGIDIDDPEHRRLDIDPVVDLSDPMVAAAMADTTQKSADMDYRRDPGAVGTSGEGYPDDD